MSVEEAKVANVDELVEEEEICVDTADGPKFAAVETFDEKAHFDTVWENKGKLLRFDEGENQWKERGSGEARIIKSKKNGSHMFVLRREGIGKLAAQHLIQKGMQCVIPPKSNVSVMWIALADYSDDDEGWKEKFYIKFSTPEVATSFKAKFDEIAK
jgi:Ran-binding protein 1